MSVFCYTWVPSSENASKLLHFASPQKKKKPDDSFSASILVREIINPTGVLSPESVSMFDTLYSFRESQREFCGPLD